MKPAPNVPPSLIQVIFVRSFDEATVFGSWRNLLTINSNGAQDAGLTFAATGQPRSLGTMKWKRSLGLPSVPDVGLLNPSNVPLILTLYQVACTSRPLKKVSGPNSPPMLQFVELSGAREIPPSRAVLRPVTGLIYWRRTVCGPPDQLTPAGVLLHAKPVAKSLAAN